MQKIYVITREIHVDEGKRYIHLRTDVDKVFSSLKKAKAFLRGLAEVTKNNDPLVYDDFVSYKVGQHMFSYHLFIRRIE